MKLAILYDVKGWAYHSEALGLKKYLDLNIKKFNIKSEIFAYPFFYSNRNIHKEYDKVFLFPRQANPMTFPADKTIVRFSSFGDYSKQEELNSIDFEKIVCMNKQICARAKKDLHGKYNCDNILYAPVSIDTSIFINSGKKNNSNGKLVVGWAGSDHRKVKRFDIISDVKAKLEGVVDFKIATYDKSKNRISQNKMPDFYNSLDLFICVSNSEGGPLTTFEAGACGVPTILSCERSAMFEATTENFDCFYVEQSAESLLEKILYLDKNRHLIETASYNIEKTIIGNYSWFSNIEKYAKIITGS